MLTLENLSIDVNDRRILSNINLTIKQGEVHALLGANGSGKTTLLLTIMGYPQYKVASGRILFKGQDVTYAPIDERARLGIGIAFQKPPIVKGISLQDAVEMVSRWSKPEVDLRAVAERLDVSYLLDRDLNLGYSGGEAKRSELLMLMAQSPDFVMFDEPESGVDLVNIGLVGEAVNKLLGKLKRFRGVGKSAGLIITHTGIILDYVNADVGHVLCDGEIICSGNPRELLSHIRQFGYENCRVCPAKEIEEGIE